jgi:hypothetical protein
MLHFLRPLPPCHHHSFHPFTTLLITTSLPPPSNPFTASGPPALGPGLGNTHGGNTFWRWSSMPRSTWALLPPLHALACSLSGQWTGSLLGETTTGGTVGRSRTLPWTACTHSFRGSSNKGHSDYKPLPSKSLWGIALLLTTPQLFEAHRMTVPIARTAEPSAHTHTS